MRGAWLRNTDLRGVDLRNASLLKANFDGADVQNVRLHTEGRLRTSPAHRS